MRSPLSEDFVTCFSVIRLLVSLWSSFFSSDNKRRGREKRLVSYISQLSHPQHVKTDNPNLSGSVLWTLCLLVDDSSGSSKCLVTSTATTADDNKAKDISYDDFKNNLSTIRIVFVFFGWIFWQCFNCSILFDSSSRRTSIQTQTQT